MTQGERGENADQNQTCVDPDSTSNLNITPSKSPSN